MHLVNSTVCVTAYVENELHKYAEQNVQLTDNVIKVSLPFIPLEETWKVEPAKSAKALTLVLS